MIFAIDIGNTNIVIGAMEPSRTLFVERLSTDTGRTDLEYALAFKTVLELYSLSPRDFEGSILSSVVPPLTGAVCRALEKLFGRAPLVVGPGVKTGLNIRIDNPAQLGSDLVVDAVAGIAEYPLPLLIVDMGTATTISAIDRQGTYIGGVIIPGAGVSLDSLSSHASQLPRISLEAPKKPIGTNTVECMKSGIVLGSASQIDGMLGRMEEELGSPATAIATGGLARFIVPYCRHRILLDDDLLLKGLRILYYRNADRLS